MFQQHPSHRVNKPTEPRRYIPPNHNLYIQSPEKLVVENQYMSRYYNQKKKKKKKPPEKKRKQHLITRQSSIAKKKKHAKTQKLRVKEIFNIPPARRVPATKKNWKGEEKQNKTRPPAFILPTSV
jgi:hypothetical protein